MIPIFSYLTIIDKNRASQVNKRWKRLLADFTLWKSYFLPLKLVTGTVTDAKDLIMKEISKLIIQTQAGDASSSRAHLFLSRLGLSTLEEARTVAVDFHQQYGDKEFFYEEDIVDIGREYLKNSQIQEAINILSDIKQPFF